jgi:hypothetical protein
MPYASSANRFSLTLFCGFSLLVPATGETGWFFKPGTFYECQKEIRNVESNKAAKYAHDNCFEELCRNKGRVIQIDNKKVIFQCEQLDSLYGEAKSKWERKNCSEWSRATRCSYDCNSQYLPESGSRCCYCVQHTKELQRIESDRDNLRCSSLADEVFVYDDKTCPGAQ